ncbi:hypothetical protein N7468_008269 [Penicillium chermesinum]|uniref:DHHA2 domain-containing protein n=1 Tax=Penicillium chermesinum TaxID=63820 RepID=A0A9W9TI46_9EURO|nr:uncharacterized protein N7468_008269 [Penicillium chermesinum]KAJ5223727.1 hypothetical protein N7468_008269 [Penicillium chermesinum]
MTLLQFLRQARQTHLQFLAGKLPEAPIYVLGNPSADLDSIVSAIIYSYCANNCLPKTKPRPHAPIFFACAQNLSPPFISPQISPPLAKDEAFSNTPASASPLLQNHLVTIADFANALNSSSSSDIHADITLVDWNALPEQSPPSPPPGTGSLGPSLPHTTTSTNTLFPAMDAPMKISPVIITVGPGSCSSLVADFLTAHELLGPDAAASDAQVAKLLLAAILIDTSNLTAEGKVTEVDKRAVSSLRGLIAKTGAPEWDSEGLYAQVLEAKQNSLNMLTLDEVLDRDFKDWSETTADGRAVKMGFCSSVKPVRWLVQKAGGTKEFVDGVRRFAEREDKGLDLVVVMTSFTAESGAFERELFVAAMGEKGAAVDGIQAFMRTAAEQLQLEDWKVADGEDVNIPDAQIRAALDGDRVFFRRLWTQKKTTASRKQVAPLLREAVAKL